MTKVLASFLRNLYSHAMLPRQSNYWKSSIRQWYVQNDQANLKTAQHLCSFEYNSSVMSSDLHVPVNVYKKL